MKRYAFVFLLLSALASCRHDEEKVPEAAVWLEVDWSHFDKESVTGMSVYCYPRTGESCKLIKTNSISGAVAYLPAGTYDFIVMNQSEREFGGIEFTGMDSFDTASALLVSEPVSWQKELKSIYDPEWLVLDRCEGFVVTEQMAEMNPDSCVVTSRGDLVASIIPIQPENITYTTKITVNIRNLDKVYSVRGILSSMAGGTGMSDGDVSQFEPLVKAMDEWERRVSEDVRNGTVSTEFYSFGPAQIEQALRDCELDLSFLLVDSKTVSSFHYEIGQFMEVDEESRTITIVIGGSDMEPEPAGENCNPRAPLLIPDDVKPGGTGSSYGVDLRDWDELVDVEIVI